MLAANDFEDVKDKVANATPAQKREIAGLAQPGGDTGRVIIWVTVLAIVAVALFMSLWLTYERSIDKADLDPFREIALLVVGGVVGLIAPSPVASG